MNANSETRSWRAIVLAAGRGPNDPLARHFGVSHKCLLPVAGVPMLRRVVNALVACGQIGDIHISLETESLLDEALGEVAGSVSFIQSQASAAQSAGHAIKAVVKQRPVLITTADHALLDVAMLQHFIEMTDDLGCDLSVGLASAETILAAYPDAKRTFLKFGPQRVSGCNLYGICNDRALTAIELWQKVEAQRKNPLVVVRAFGLHALLRYVTGTINLEGAFRLASRRLGIDARPVLMPFANAAVDVDKPEDKELVEKILG
jgi:CTP:molybdopterin cytidylyltransferase MocA